MVDKKRIALKSFSLKKLQNNVITIKTNENKIRVSIKVIRQYTHPNVKVLLDSISFLR